MLAAGVLLKGQLEGVLEPALDAGAPGDALGEALRVSLGESRLLVFGVASILTAWACCPRGLAQRFAIGVPLAVALVLLGPSWAEWISANLTGPSYWRSMWAMPVPILMALVLTAPLHLGSHLGNRWGGPGWRVAGVAGCVAAMAAFAALVPRFSVFSEQNGGVWEAGMRVTWPALKVPEHRYRWAAALNTHVRAGERVVAPPDVSPWVPTFHHHAYPVMVRSSYLERQARYLDHADVRTAMSLYVDGKPVGNFTPDRFRRGLEHFDVKAVCLRNSERAPDARAVLEEAGFQRAVQGLTYEIWVRRG